MRGHITPIFYRDGPRRESVARAQEPTCADAPCETGRLYAESAARGRVPSRGARVECLATVIDAEFAWMRAKVAPRAALKRLVRSRDALEQIGAMGGAGAGFITGAGGEGVHSIPPLWYVGAVGDGEETATSSLHDV